MQMQEHDGMQMMPKNTSMAVSASIGPPTLLGVMARRWRVVALAVALCVAAAGAYLAWARPVYVSSAQLYLDRGSSKDLAVLGLQWDGYVAAQSEMVKSMPVIAAALARPETRDMQMLNGVADPAGHIQNVLDVSVGRKDGIITVSFGGPAAAESASLVNAIVQAYVERRAQEKAERTNVAINALVAERAKAEANRVTKGRDVAALSASAGGLGADDDGRYNKYSGELSAALTSAQIATIQAKAAYQAAQETLEDPEKARQFVASQDTGGVSLEAGKEVTQLRSQLTQMELRLATMKQQYAAQHPRLLAAEQEAEQVRNKLAERERGIIEAYVAALRQKWTAATQKEQEIAAALTGQQKRMASAGQTVAAYSQAQADLKRAETSCDVLDARIKELELAAAGGGADVTIIEPALAPRNAARPVPAQAMTLAVLLGLVLGAGGVLVREKTDQRFRSAQEIEEALGLPVLGVLPRKGTRGNLFMTGRQVQLDPSSDASEAYRVVRTLVYFATRQSGCRRLLITSPGAGDGKTAVAANLAISMGQAGDRTLLIDANLRQPAQQEVFALSGEAALCGVLSGQTPLRKAIQHTEIKDLHVLPAGSTDEYPCERLVGEGFSQVVEQLSREYDYVIFDSPAVMPLTDARILGGLCDATLLVVSAGSSRTQAARACHALRGAGAQILGVIVNGDLPCSEYCESVNINGSIMQWRGQPRASRMADRHDRRRRPASKAA